MAKKEKNKEQKINFKLTEIELVHSNLFHAGLPLQEKQTFHFNIKIEQRINLEKKVIVFAPEIEVQHEDKKTILGSIKVACIFLVENMEDFKKEDSDVIVLPNEIITMFNSISLSTARGVMFSQFRGTILHKAILPVLDPKVFERSSSG